MRERSRRSRSRVIGWAGSHESREAGLPTLCNASRWASRLRCAAHPGYAGVRVPGDLHHSPGRGLGSELLEQQEEWQLERRRFFSEATMAKIPEPEEPLELTGGDRAEQTAAAIS